MCHNILKEKLYEALVELKIPSKLIRLINGVMGNFTTQIRIKNELTESFQVKNGLKKGDGLAPVLFNLTLEYIIRKLLLTTDSTVMYRSVQVMGYADDINILGRSRMAVNEAYTALKNQAKTVGLNINTDNIKALVQTTDWLLPLLKQHYPLTKLFISFSEYSSCAIL
jgi:hypothetical protein